MVWGQVLEHERRLGHSSATDHTPVIAVEGAATLDEELHRSLEPLEIDHCLSEAYRPSSVLVATLLHPTHVDRRLEVERSESHQQVASPSRALLLEMKLALAGKQEVPHAAAELAHSRLIHDDQAQQIPTGTHALIDVGMDTQRFVALQPLDIDSITKPR